jgi:hypothetical protein
LGQLRRRVNLSLDLAPTIPLVVQAVGGSSPLAYPSLVKDPD